jgi:membrane-bound ClpP family serine protease
MSLKDEVGVETLEFEYEDLYLNSVRNIIILFAAGFALFVIETTKYVDIAILLIAVFLTVVTQVAYLFEREDYARRVGPPPLRVDFYWVVTTLILLVLLYVVYDRSFSCIQW